jgi:predicted MPP superfamily phosphohydrolase
MSAPIPNVEEAHVSSANSKPPEGASAFTWWEIARFGTIVSSILLTANAMVCATWSYFFGVPGWIAWQALPGAMAIVFIPATILRFRSTHPALKVVYALSAMGLGALNFATFAALACWIVLGAAWLFGFPLARFEIAAVMFSLALAATVYGLINARTIRINRITVRLPNLPEAWQGRKAALVTDLHLGPLSGAAFLRRVIARLRSLKPEAVFISGDMFDGPTIGLDQLVAPWREYTSPQGIYYVTGNHDEFAERSLYLDPARRVGIQVLNNEKICLNGLQLVGIHDSEAGNPNQLREILREVQIDREHPVILLAHRPINLAVAEEEGVSLQLSGHTHGGQLWPWNLLVHRIYGRFAYGLSRLNKMQVYTSSGVGTWGLPLRVGTQSEVVLLRFEKEYPYPAYQIDDPRYNLDKIGPGETGQFAINGPAISCGDLVRLGRACLTRQQFLPDP